MQRQVTWKPLVQLSDEILELPVVKRMCADVVDDFPGFMTLSKFNDLDTSCSLWMMQWKFQNSGNVWSALHSPTTPFTDSIMAGAPSVAIAVSFGMGRFAFPNAAIIVSFTSMPRVLSFNGTISRSSSLITQSFDTDRANIAN